MKRIIEFLQKSAGVSDYRIIRKKTDSYELFFVKGRLETVRHTDVCDTSVTVYVDHDSFKGESEFRVYPSTDDAELAALIEDAVSKALLIDNRSYSLPSGEKGEYTVESNFSDYSPEDLAAVVANAVFDSNTVENASLNSVEIFINHIEYSVVNSRGLEKTQRKYTAMVEAIPTYNGEAQSVELYEQYNFSSLDLDELCSEISRKMHEVKSRYEAVKPSEPISCPVILRAGELSSLVWELARDLSYTNVYTGSNLYKKGDSIQKQPTGDLLGISLCGKIKGAPSSSCFDSDGLDLGEVRVIDGGKAVAYHGNNAYGQYLGEKPTGSMSCIRVDLGSASGLDSAAGLEVLSMSGLQVDAYNDYIGGEVRLALLRDASGNVTPVTGISIAGSLSQVLSSLRLSSSAALDGSFWGSYYGPDRALIDCMKIF